MNIEDLIRKKGIAHIEELPTHAFIKYVREIEHVSISEKLDGANLQVGIDEHGFYTSRGQKGGDKQYNSDSYGTKFASTYMRAAHDALDKVKDTLEESGVRQGVELNLEVFFGALPNTVPYNADGINRIVFLGQTAGDKINLTRLAKDLNGVRVTIQLQNVPDTEDGKDINYRTRNYVFEFAQVPQITNKISDSRVQQIEQELTEYEKWLGNASELGGIPNQEAINLNMNKIKKDKRDNAKAVRENIKGQDLQFKMLVKNVLLDTFVRDRGSKFGPKPENGGWIEGVALKDRNGNLVKLVDKDIFLKRNVDNHELRNEIGGQAKTPDLVEGMWGDIKLTIATALGHPELGTYQAKRYLQKFEDPVQELSDFDITSVSNYLIPVLKDKQDNLHSRLEQYNSEKNDNKHIHERNLQTFAEVNKYIEDIVDYIKEPDAKPQGLLMKLVKDKL